ncbi:MAG: hypothetical protein J6T53_06630 [Bacteroidales bacterium]|nr:hypothetical protein [Bacteroidales bacterium]
MKKLFLILTLAFASYIVDAQTINLVKDESYAVNEDFFDALGQAGTLYNVKKLTVFDDGTAMISHTNENRYSLFDENGKHLKDIEIYYEDGKKKPFNLQPVFGKINNLYFTGSNSNGIIYFFNDNGLIVNEITIDCSVYNMIPLDDNHIAFYGGTSWRTKWRDFVAILDINTGKYKIIFDYYEDTPSKNDDYYIYAKAHVNKRPEIFKVNDNLIIAIPQEGVLNIYNLAGNKVSEHKLDWKPKTLSVEEQKKIQAKAIAKYKQEAADAEHNIYFNDFILRLENGMDHITQPLSLSKFTLAIKGNGDNIIFFEYAEESGQNSFHTYSVGQHKTISQNTFQCSDFDLSITKNRFVIHNGYVYGIQNVKGSEEELRLVRFVMK